MTDLRRILACLRRPVNWFPGWLTGG